MTSRPDGGTPGEALQREALVVFDTKAVRPALASFLTEARALESATAAWAQAGTMETLVPARQAFERAFLSWQRLELMQVGPLGRATQVTAGQGLRDELYSWPSSNLCRVDAALVAQTTPDDAFFDTALVSSKTLVVLEYLLWELGPTNACPANATINTDGSWATLASGPELSNRRRAWANGVARHLARTAQRAQATWIDPGGFGERLQAAGRMGSEWRTPKDALDDVFAGAFYVDRFVKDLKLGGPAGITAACMAQTCPELAESPRALLSSKALVENLVALELVFTGDTSPTEPAAGFDDLLAERGAQQLRDDMLARLNEALVDARGLSAPIQQAVGTNHDAVIALHAQVKQFTDLLKSQFVTTLALKVPREGAGDND